MIAQKTGKVPHHLAKIKEAGDEFARSLDTWIRDRQAMQAAYDKLPIGAMIVTRGNGFVVFNRRAGEIIGVGLTRQPFSTWPEHFQLRDPETGQIIAPHQLPSQRAMASGKTVHTEMLAGPRRVRIFISAEPLSVGKEIIGAVLFFDTVPLAEEKRGE